MITLYRGALVIQPTSKRRFVLFAEPSGLVGIWRFAEQDGPVRRRWAQIGAFGRMFYAISARTATTWRPLSDDPADHLVAILDLPAGADVEFDAEWNRLEASGERE